MSREPRWMFVVYSVGLGVLLAIAALIGGEPSFAIFALALMTVFGVVASFTPCDRRVRTNANGRSAVRRQPSQVAF